MKVAASDGVKVYNVSEGKTLPEWLSEGKKRSLKKDEEYRRRLELLQDFSFPAAAQRIKATPDGAFIYATGIHPPRVRCFETSQLSMKFERHLDAEVVDFQILSEDYNKVAFLCADRSIAFHAKFGAYYNTRVPKFGRDICYYPYTADLLVAASSNEVYRLNLEEGRFVQPLASRSPGVNKLAISPVHGLVGAAGEEGLLECYDLRQEQCAGRFDAATSCGASGQVVKLVGQGQGVQGGAALTALTFDETGLQCAVGTSTGLISIYDLRWSKPMIVKDHMYSSPIINLTFRPAELTGGVASKSMVSADKHIVRVWEAETGKGITSIQPAQAGINDVLLCRDSGLVLMACDQPKLQAYFIPKLGPAPKWCSFLESLTEEMEETGTPAVYDDYRFVTNQELQRLGMSHLIGSSLLRAYMHGYFVHNKLYQKAKAIAAPTDYATVRKQRIQNKLEEQRGQRITLKRKMPKVNALFAAKLLSDGDKAAGSAKKAKVSNASLLADDRFSSLFNDPAFAIDEKSEEYKLLHPNRDSMKDRSLVREHFEVMEADSEEQHSEASQEELSDLSSDIYETGLYDPGRGADPTQGQASASLPRKVPQGRHGSRPQMMAAKSPAAATAFQKRESLADLQGIPLADRAERAILNHGKQGFRIGGQREMSFMPRGRGRGRRGGAGGQSREVRPLPDQLSSRSRTVHSRGRGTGQYRLRAPGRGRSRGRGRGR